MAEPTPNPTKTTEPTPPTPPEPPAPNNGDNQKAIDEAIAKAKAEWEKEVEEKIKKAEEEGMRKAKLTNEQRKKEDDDKEREEFEKAKAEFEREKIVAYAETELAKVGLSAEIAKYIVAEDKDSTKTVIDKIKERCTSRRYRAFKGQNTEFKRWQWRSQHRQFYGHNQRKSEIRSEINGLFEK